MINTYARKRGIEYPAEIRSSPSGSLFSLMLVRLPVVWPLSYSSRRLSENGYYSQSLRQAQIIILEILLCIPVVIIFAFLDLEKNFSFSDSLLGGLGSLFLCQKK